MAIDLNSDVGESFGKYSLGCDQDVLKHITSANVACGFHASDPLVMERTVLLAKKNNVGVGAHPGFPDRRGFGRRAMDCTTAEVRGDVLYQIGALAAIAKTAGLTLQHVKPHGALYNTAAKNENIARGVCQAMADYDPGLILVLLAGPGGEMIRSMALEHGLKVAREVFADRAYTPEGSLQPRGTEGAVLEDPEMVALRCLRMARDKEVVANDGSVIKLEADTICVHGDTSTAVQLVARIKETLLENKVELKPLGSLI